MDIKKFELNSGILGLKFTMSNGIIEQQLFHKREACSRAYSLLVIKYDYDYDDALTEITEGLEDIVYHELKLLNEYEFLTRHKKEVENVLSYFVDRDKLEVRK